MCVNQRMCECKGYELNLESLVVIASHKKYVHLIAVSFVPRCY